MSKHRAAGSVFILIAFFCFSPASFAGGINWQDRVLPLPKEMSVSDSLSVRAGDISYRIEASEDAPPFRTVDYLMEEFARGEGGGAVHISLVLLDGAGAEVPGVPAARLRGLPNSEQAYAITYERGYPLRFTLAAETPVGLLYAARTLNQLIKPAAGTSEDTVLEIPLAAVVDWPDIKQRGEWLPSGYTSWGWFSRWKLNMYKATVRSDAIAGEELPGFSLRGARTEDSYLPWARELGYAVIPYIGHLGYRSVYEWSHISPAVYTDEHPPPPHYRGFCWSDEGIYKVLTDHMSRMAEIAMEFPEGHRDIEVWLTELDRISCYCEGCGGEDGYILEANGIIEVWNDIRADYPGVRLRIMLSQGTANIEGRLLEIAGKHDVGVTYYDGGPTYTIYREPMIFDALEEYGRAGGITDVVPIVTPCYNALYPASLPHVLKLRAQEYADKHLTAATGYSQLGQFYYPLNMAAWGEYLWNANGRSVYDFARAYAVIEGITAPDLFGRWAVKAGEAAFELAASRYMVSLARRHYARLPVMLDEDEYQELDTIRTGRVMDDARQALLLAREAGDPMMLLESEATLAALKSIDLRSDIRMMMGVPENRNAVAEKLEKLDICAQLIRANVYVWSGIAERKMEYTGYPSMMYPPDQDIFRVGVSRPRNRQKQQAYCLLRASDVDRRSASLYGIEDTRGEMGPVEIGEWSGEIFEAGNAVIEKDISEFVPLPGGDYNLGLNYLEGPRTRMYMVSVFRVDARTGDRTELERVEHTFRTVPDCLLEIPGRESGDKLILNIELRQGSPASEGYITLRRVLSRDEFPEEDIDLLLR